MALIEHNSFFNCSKLTSIEVHSKLSCICIKNGHNRHNHSGDEIINNKLGKLTNAFENLSLSPTSQKMCKLFLMEKYYLDMAVSQFTASLFINWRIYSKNRDEQGRLPLFTALEHNLELSDGLDKIWENNGAAVEEADITTGLEAFMLAAVGSNSYIGTIFHLLQDHPAALNPYVTTIQQNVI